MISRNIFYSITAIIFLLFYLLIPFSWITDLISHISFDRKIDTETIPYLSSIYHAMMLGAIFVCILLATCRKKLPHIAIFYYRIMYTLTPYKWFMLICCIAIIIRFFLLCTINVKQVSDFQEYHDFAKQIASGEGYMRHGQPTAWFPIGYPLFLSLLYRICGQYELAGQLSNVFLSLVIIIATYYIATKLFSPTTAKLASLLVAIWPNLLAYTGLLCSDILFSSIFIVMLAILIYVTRKNYIPYMLIGLLFGLSTLTRTGFALFIIVVLCYLFINRANQAFHLFSIRIVLLLLTSILVFAPWWIRNYQVFDHFIPLSTNGGFNFWLGNVQLTQSNDPGTMDTVWPDTEYAMSSHGYKLGWNYIKKNPAAFLHQLPIKAINLFILDISGWRWLKQGSSSTKVPFFLLIAFSQLFYMLMILFAGIGFFFTGKYFLNYFKMGHYLMIATLCYWIVIHCIFFGKDRYHLPLIPIMAIYAAQGLLGIFNHLNNDMHNINMKE